MSSTAWASPVRNAHRIDGRTAPVAGPILFARYAYGPNRLGYCGPDAVEELWGEGTSGGDGAALRELARSFEGAWPYLELIATANGIPDPLDRRVVEAYWLGNDLLASVRPGLMAASLEQRFRPRTRPESWRWLAGKPSDGARPVHAFHVLDVFPRIGLMRSGSVERALETMDSCRIRWGRVLERDGDWLVVDAVPLVLTDGRLALGAPRLERIQAWRDGTGFVNTAEPGDVISIHWSWACDRLSARQVAGLVRSTRHQIAIANRTI